MAEGVHVELDEDDEDLQQAIKVNGRYVDPWGTASMPSTGDVLRWKFFEKSDRGIGGTWRELFRFKHEVRIQEVLIALYNCSRPTSKLTF